MKGDLLERAAGIARERYLGESKQAATTEARVLAACTRQTRRSNRLPLLAIPLVAALLASAAWGTAGEQLRAWVQTLSGGQPALNARLPAKAVAPSPAVPTQLPKLPSLEPPAPTAMASSALPSARPQRLPPLAKPTPTAPSAPTESEIDALYRAAHRAQFAGDDPARALLLWDRYLATAPNGSLSPEARYNRAIALARLGRKAEAAKALEPFARGEYGDYRKTEARSLLEVLRPSAAPSATP